MREAPAAIGGWTEGIREWLVLRLAINPVNKLTANCRGRMYGVKRAEKSASRNSPISMNHMNYYAKYSQSIAVVTQTPTVHKHLEGLLKKLVDLIKSEGRA
jgi:hypothetical protein